MSSDEDSTRAVEQPDQCVTCDSDLEHAAFPVGHNKSTDGGLSYRPVEDIDGEAACTRACLQKAIGGEADA